MLLKSRRMTITNKLIADNTNHRSVASYLRRKRFDILLTMIQDFAGSVHILDIGGRLQYWEMMRALVKFEDRIHITLLNVDAKSINHPNHPNFSCVLGDGRAMPQYEKKQFDIVFSNSTIEHVGTRADQEKMAKEVRRVGLAYFIQTPNRYFPIEPHFVFPMFQFLPMILRVWLVQHFACGWYGRIDHKRDALREVSSIKLLSRRDLQNFFPEAKIFEERYCGMVKSFVAYYSPLCQ